MSCWASMDIKKKCALLQLGWGGGCNNSNERLLLFQKKKSKKSHPENLETGDCSLRFSRPMPSSPISHHGLGLSLTDATWPLWFLGRVSVQRKEERRLVSGKPKLTQGPPHGPPGLTGQNVSAEEQRECRNARVHPPDTPGLCAPPSVRHLPCLFLTQIKSMRLNLIQI